MLRVKYGAWAPDMFSLSNKLHLSKYRAQLLLLLYSQLTYGLQALAHLEALAVQPLLDDLGEGAHTARNAQGGQPVLGLKGVLIVAVVKLVVSRRRL